MKKTNEEEDEFTRRYKEMLGDNAPDINEVNGVSEVFAEPTMKNSVKTTMLQVKLPVDTVRLYKNLKNAGVVPVGFLADVLTKAIEELASSKQLEIEFWCKEFSFTCSSK